MNESLRSNISEIVGVGTPAVAAAPAAPATALAIWKGMLGTVATVPAAAAAWVVDDDTSSISRSLNKPRGVVSLEMQFLAQQPAVVAVGEARGNQEAVAVGAGC